MPKQAVISKLFSLFLFGIILIVGYRQRNEIYQLLQRTKFNWLTLGVLFYFCNYLTRAYRLQILTGSSDLSLLLGLKTASLHGCYSYFLPFRTGDLTLPFFLKKFSLLPLASGGGVLVRARLLDMVSLGILLAFSTFLSYRKLDNESVLCFLLASMILIGAPFFIKLAIRQERWLPRKWVGSFSSNVNENPLRLKEVGLSLLVWFWVGCTLFSATEALSIPIQFMDIWFLVAIQLPLQLLPIQGVANAGNHEVGWVAGFTLLGIAPAKGLEFAVASHLIIIVYVIALGFLGFLIPVRAAKQ
jgi:hypothetical protein